jgi:putative Holliday junction resolvase
VRTLGLDYGERRVGVAVSDPTDRIAQPLETVPRTERAPERTLERIRELTSDYEVRRIVVGLPLQMDGRSGEQADRARAFGAAVAEVTGLPVEYQDERLTSVEATRALSRAGGRPSRNRDRVDRVAAALLLDTFLARDRQERNREGRDA